MSRAKARSCATTVPACTVKTGNSVCALATRSWCTVDYHVAANGLKIKPRIRSIVPWWTHAHHMESCARKGPPRTERTDTSGLLVVPHA